MHNRDNEELPRNSDGDVLAYSFPGSYPIRYIVADGGSLCAACVNGGNGSRADDALSPEYPEDEQWIVVGCQTEEAPEEDICCDHCGTIIAMAAH